MTKREQFIKFLKKELNGSANVKDFSNNLRYLNICDLSKDRDLDVVTENGGAYLQTLVTWQQLGLIPKMIEIKTKIEKGIQ